MDRDEILEKMITRAAAARRFGDWADVLSNYAACLTKIESTVSLSEMEGLISAGADFYRTLARAEDYRRSSQRPA